ncbi:phage/plasmid primase, P4 family [Acidithiobacillus sp.]|uniref:DNA primase family protein n=1 Tax=Acidithiobacillus sp. TaxID=1872118 RepID=UPI0025C4113C|nr:phage/plasmid primase, P4 family [Acidithiobacillus sp.]
MTRQSVYFRPHQYVVAALATQHWAVQGNVLYRWNDTHWSVVEEVDAKRDTYAWLAAQDASWAGAENATSAVQALRLAAPRLPKPTKDIVVPTQNGHVHLDGGALLLKCPDPALGLTHCLNCQYAPGQTSPRFTAFLHQVLPDPEVQRRVQEYVGYTLISDARYQRAQFWLGQGANGKGVLANIVQALHSRVAAIVLDQLNGFRLSNLVGASLVYVDEAPRKPIDEQLLKSMIAGEMIQIDRKYRDPLSVPVRGKWIVLGNHLPAITDHSIGFWRRWDIVPFSVTIPERERDPLLAETIIREELSGVLNWALEGLVRLQTRGAFDPVMPQAMRELLHEAKVETNSVVAWVDDEGITLKDSIDTPKAQVFASYAAWCENNAMRAVSSVQFWKRMREQFTRLAEARTRLEGGVTRRVNVHLPTHTVRTQ